MKYTIEMGSSVITYKPSFIKIGSGTRKLVEDDLHTQTELRSQKPTFVSSK
jgi:hypothetical protein